MALQNVYKDVLDVAKNVGAKVESREENGKLIIQGTVDRYPCMRSRVRG